MSLYINNPQLIKRDKNNGKTPLLILLIISGFYAMFSLGSCAVVRAPTGGPKDTIPPRLLGSIPRNYTREFSGKEIELIFDEFIKIKDQSSSVFISPEPEKQTEIKVSKKSIHIAFKSELLKNTTYSINFGNSIVDYNEGNAYKNFKFVFSTGKKIDSLKISGHVSDPLDTTSKKDVYVILHKAGDDSAIIKKKPLLFTSTDKEGNFELANISPGNYAIYALEETNKNKKYDANNESIAFLNQPIHLKKDTSGINIYLFKEKNDKLKILNKKIVGGLLKIVLNQSIDSLDFKLLSPVIKGQAYYVEKRPAGDSVLMWMPSANLDSVKIGIIENGKTVLKFTQNNYVKTLKEKRFLITDNIKNGLKSPAKPLTITMGEPIDSMKRDLFVLKEDSIAVQADSIVHIIKSVRSYEIYYPWESNRKYEMSVKAGSYISIYNNKNVEYKKSFLAGAERNYGTIILKIVVPRKSSYIVILMNEAFQLLEKKRIFDTSTLSFKYIEPGKYRFRVIYDTNNNGKYDTGNLLKKIQAEKIINSKEITTRSNFELNTTFPIPDL